MFFMWSARLTRLNFCWLVKCFYNQIMFPPQIQVFGWVKKKPCNKNWWLMKIFMHEINLISKWALIPNWSHNGIIKNSTESKDLLIWKLFESCANAAQGFGLNRRGSDHQDALMLVIIGTPGGVCCYYFQHLIVTNLSFIPWNKAKTKLGHDTTIWIDCW